MNTTVSCIKQAFWSSSNLSPISIIVEDVEDTNEVTHYDYHILQSYLPDRPDIHYYLRECYHNKVLFLKTADLNDRDFRGHNLCIKEFIDWNHLTMSNSAPAFLCLMICVLHSHIVCSCKLHCAYQLINKPK